MSQGNVEVIDLLEMSRRLAPDSDRPITGQVDGAVALIRLEKGIEYASEQHASTETVTAIEGTFAILAEGSRHTVKRGSCIRIPPGVEHRWDPSSDAVVLVTFSTPM